MPVLVVLVVGLLGIETATRFQLFAMSKDFRAFLGYPARAAALGQQDGIRVAVVGNSVARENFDPSVIAERLETLTDRPVHADVFSADHSYINTWRFMIEHYFWRAGNRVDLIVIPFWFQNLYDGNELEVARLAQFFTSARDWPEVLRDDLDTTAERADFLVSTVWASFAARERIRELLFTRILPDYQGYARLEQAVMDNRRAVTALGKPKRVRGLGALKRLLHAAREHDTKLCFLAVPTLHTNWGDSYGRLLPLIEEAGMHYLDLRDTQLDAESYVDLVHMSAGGRALFSRRVGDAIAPLVRCTGGDCTIAAAPRLVAVD